MIHVSTAVRGTTLRILGVQSPENRIKFLQALARNEKSAKLLPAKVLEDIRAGTYGSIKTK